LRTDTLDQIGHVPLQVANLNDGIVRSVNLSRIFKDRSPCFAESPEEAFRRGSGFTSKLESGVGHLFIGLWVAAAMIASAGP
jgi:hypothetical protein